MSREIREQFKQLSALELQYRQQISRQEIAYAEIKGMNFRKEIGLFFKFWKENRPLEAKIIEHAIQNKLDSELIAFLANHKMHFRMITIYSLLFVGYNVWIGLYVLAVMGVYFYMTIQKDRQTTGLRELNAVTLDDVKVGALYRDRASRCQHSV